LNAYKSRNDDPRCSVRSGPEKLNVIAKLVPANSTTGARAIVIEMAGTSLNKSGYENKK
jgi:hypothetical protein